MRTPLIALPLLCLGVASLAIAGGHSKKPDEPIMPVPPAISEPAQAYYENLRPRSPEPLDLENPKILNFTREFLGKMFVKNAEALGIPWELEAVDADGVEAWWVKVGEQDTKRVLVYFHGGGQVLGSPTTNLVLPIRIAKASGFSVLSVKYRLAPEHPFPAGQDDAVTVYQWLLDEGYAPQNIGLFGDSAGGNIALTTALRARAEELPQPAGLVLLSPSIDRTFTGDSHFTMGEFDPVLGKPGKEVYAVNHPVDDPLVSPVYADLTGLPPILVQTGTRERLLSDSVRLVKNARRDGVEVTFDLWDGMWHVWQANPEMPEATQAAQEIGDWFRAKLAASAD